MARYFLEVAYDGSRHSGFQIQKNAETIQGELNRSLEVILKEKVVTFGSSRTDAGVHAFQNFFHIDLNQPLGKERLYNINAILPETIVLKNIFPVVPDAHARFSALSRTYRYIIYKNKNPFLRQYGYHYPFVLDLEEMKKATRLLSGIGDFEPFSKRNTQVYTFLCDIQMAEWEEEDDHLIFKVTSNRFLRGMVRGLVGTLLKVGRRNLKVEDFRKILDKEMPGEVDFSVPARGLFLEKISFPEALFL